MNITLEKNLLVNNFLVPVSRISDEVTITLFDKGIRTLTCDSSETIILFCEVTCQVDVQKEVELNIKDCKKFIRVLDCVQDDNLTFNIDDNCSVIKYNSVGVKFKYHLVHNSVIRKGKVSLSKLRSFKFDTEFTMTGEDLQSIIKSTSFSPDTEKVYLYQEGNNVLCEITDKTIQDTDSFTRTISNNISGKPISRPIPMSLEKLRLINSNKTDVIHVKFNPSFGFFTFNVNQPNSEMLYAIPAMAK